MMKQYNFKITPELEKKVKKVLKDSRLSGKSEFLDEMVTVYSSHLVNRDNEINLDVSAYKHINSKTKEVLEKTFNHLLSSMDYNFSSVLQEKLFIKQEKKRLAEKSVEINGQVDKIKVELLEERKVLEARLEEKVRLLVEEKEILKDKLDEESSQLVKVNKELSALSTIAEQTSTVMQENKDLRAIVSSMEREHLEDKRVLEEKYLFEIESLKGSVDELEGSIRIEEKKLFEVSHTLGRCEEDLKLVKEKGESDLMSFKQREEENQLKLNSLLDELGKVNSLYNQLLGKVEVFEIFGKDNNLMGK